MNWKTRTAPTKRRRYTPRYASAAWLPLLLLAAVAAAAQSPAKATDRSAYFAFVDRQYVFTVEMVSPGVPILNFVYLDSEEHVLSAKQVRVALEDRRVAAKFFVVDTGNPKEPMIVPSVRMRPRSSFGVRLQGEFGGEKELLGVRVRVADQEFRLAPLSSLDFESLVVKVNRLNLDSPDINDDWRVLKLETLGERMPARGQ
jgi:hypothetical protein